MKKPILLIGAGATGKSMLTRIFIGNLFAHNENIAFAMHDRKKKPLMYNDKLFNQCTPDTRVIVLEDVRDKKILDEVMSLNETGIFVDKRGESPFQLNPSWIVISCEIKAEDIRPVIARHFDIVELTSPLNIKVFST